MKTFLLSSFLVAITTTGFTQISKGQFLIGGNINFESVKNENSYSPSNESTKFFTSPNIGYFIFDKMAGGLRINFDLYDSKSGTVETHYTATSISPFLRCYFLPVTQKVNAFVDVSYLHNKTKWSNLTNPAYYEKLKGYSIAGGPSVFLTRQIALEFTLGFNHTKSDAFEATKSNTFNTGLGLQIHFGKSKI